MRLHDSGATVQLQEGGQCAALFLLLNGSLREQSSRMEALLVICLAIVISGFIGAMVGTFRQRGFEGMLFGGFLGPIGWIIAALLPEPAVSCPECFGPTPPGAKRCMHCGVKFEPDRARWYLQGAEKSVGPFTTAELRQQIKVGALQGDVLCAQDGDNNWRPVREVL